MNKLIHFGCTSIDKDKFIEVSKVPADTALHNICCNKPYGGLWASSFTPDDEYFSSWEDFAVNNLTRPNLYNAVVFNLKETARVYTIDSLLDLVELQEKYPTTTNRLPEILTEGKLDFIKMSKDYDALYLTEKGMWETRYTKTNTYGWDCESIVIFTIKAIDLNSQEPYERNKKGELVKIWKD